ncbi:MAG: putative transport system permease protein [bacterium]
MRSYVWRDLLRNPRRTLASLAGVVLGVGLFSGVLFFVDGSRASMTQRAIAPLALDMQRVLDNTQATGVRFTERLVGARALRPGETARIELVLDNRSANDANEVVVQDEAPAPLRYVRASARRDGVALPQGDRANPFSQGSAGTGLNIGTLPAGHVVRLTFRVTAARAVRDSARLKLGGRLSTRENVVPVRSNTPPPLTAEQLRSRLARIPGVTSADTLSSVDLAAGSLRSGSRAVPGPVRVFAFDERYLHRYPSIRLVSGALGGQSAVLSAEASRYLRAGVGGRIGVRLPGGAEPLSLPVSGVADLGRAKPLFYSRKTRKLEDFLYVPDTVIVSPETFRRSVLPAFSAANARLGSTSKTAPVSEVDLLVQRSRLETDPGRALTQTEAVAKAVSAVGPGQGQLIDNISNALQVARDDAAAARRMFIILGLPGILLGAFLTAYAGSILAAAQRREHAILRIRGAHRGHLLRMLTQRTLALAGAGALLGTLLGFLSDLVILGSDTLLRAAAGDLLKSALIAIAIGMATTAVALYVPGRRWLHSEISQERRAILSAAPAWWRRMRLDYIALGAIAIAEVLALRAGTFDPPAASVSEGQAVSLPSRLLLAPVVTWLAGMALWVRVTEAATSRLPLPRGSRFGSPVSGTLVRSLRRRASSLATGIAGVTLVVAFGTAIALFAASYDDAKRGDSAFVVGSDIRVTPSVLSVRPHPASYVRELRVPGVAGATPVVAKLENSVLVGEFDQNRQDLVAIDPASFERVAGLRDAFFVGQTAAQAMHALAANPRGLLVGEETADDLEIEDGDRVQVLLARGTKQQTLAPFEVVGIFSRLTGFPQGAGLVANIATYRARTGVDRADFFLVKSGGDLGRAVSALRAGPGRADALNIDTRVAALDKDQSSLTALNIQGLVDLDSFYTLLMSAAVIAIFVFGLMLERRREYMTLRAQGMRSGELRALVLGEIGVVAALGLVAGLVVGTAMAALLVHALRGLFLLRPDLSLPAVDIATLAGLAVLATVASAVIAAGVLQRMRPTELLRDS